MLIIGNDKRLLQHQRVIIIEIHPLPIPELDGRQQISHRVLPCFRGGHKAVQEDAGFDQKFISGKNWNNDRSMYSRWNIRDIAYITVRFAQMSSGRTPSMSISIWSTNWASRKIISYY